MLAVAHKRVRSASRGKVTVKVFVISEKLGKSASLNLSLGISSAGFFSVFADLAPESLRVTENFELRVLFEHFFKAGKSYFINNSVITVRSGSNMNRNGQAELLAE